MKVIINSQPHEVDKGISVSALLEQLNIGAKGVAIAIAGHIIPRTQWDSHTVNEETDITIIRATCGG